MGIHRQITNREVDYHQRDMDYMQEKIAISIMKRTIELEVKMDRVKVFHQLVPRTKPDDEIIPDDESINTIFALMILRESRLPTIERMSFFFRTYFVDN